jgi:quercetin dioxygenase-like cupin family protein
MNKKSKTSTQQALQHPMQPIDRRCFVRLTALAALSALATGAHIVNASAAMCPQAEQRARVVLSSKLHTHEEKDMSTKMNPTTGVRLDLFGPTVEFLTSPQEASIDFCVLKGVIPPGVSVPLHSHPDTEDFFVISGKVQALRQGARGYEWIEAKAGDYLHVPSGTRHAWRNVSSEPLVSFIITTTRLARFFQEVGRPAAAVPQTETAEGLVHFLAHYGATSAKYGYWNATPEENAAVGIRF